MEAIAIIGCIAAVITAYNDGAIIVQKIKDKRRARKALPPTALLEESLEKGPQAVEAVRNDGVQRFGSAYAVGDTIATNALKDILIELQGSLLRHLRDAQEDDGMIDFSILVDASDEGRIRTVNVLNDLYLRIAKATPAPLDIPKPLPSLPLSPFNEVLVTNNTQTIGANRESNPVPRPSSHGRAFPVLGRRETTEPDSSSKQRKWSGMFSRKTPSSGEESKLAESKSAHFLSSSPGSDDSFIRHSGASSRLSAWKTSPEISIDEDNPWSSEPSVSYESQRTSLPESSAPPERVPKPLVRWPSTASTMVPDEVYGGFCKGAYKLQVGLKDGLKLRNQSGSFQGEGYYWACGSSKCAFEGQACKTGKEWGFNDTVHTVDGVQYRWSFLAKSHVTMSKAKHGIYDYRCIFCVLQGHPSPIFQKIKVLMEHVAQHRGQHIDEAILRKTKCIITSFATDKGDFDICLPPLMNENDTAGLDDSGIAVDKRTMSHEVPQSWSTNNDTMSNTNLWRDLI